MAVLSVLRYWLSWHSLIVFAAGCVLIVITFIDIDTREIPNVLNLILLGLGIVSIFLVGGVPLLYRFIGIAAVAGPMLILDLIIPDSFGGGDIKMCAACGFLLGWQALLVGTFIAIIGGGVYGVILLASKKAGKKDHFAFGPFLGAGMIVALLAGQTIWNHYLGVFGLQ